MRLDENTERLPSVRKAHVTALARQRYATRYAANSRERGLSYALLLIMLFQTSLLSCAIFAFGGLMLLNLSNLLYRPPVAAVAVADVSQTPTPAATLVAPLTPPEVATPLPVTPAAPDSALPTATVITNPINSPVATLLPTLPFTPTNNVPSQVSVSPEIQAYANQVLPPLNNLASAVEGLRALAQNPTVNDAQWVANVKAQISLIQTNHEQLRNLQPPPEAHEVHNALLNILSTCRTAADTISAAITNNNPGNLATVMPSIKRCNAQLPTAANNLREWIKVKTGIS